MRAPVGHQETKSQGKQKPGNERARAVVSSLRAARVPHHARVAVPAAAAPESALVVRAPYSPSASSICQKRLLRAGAGAGAFVGLGRLSERLLAAVVFSRSVLEGQSRRVSRADCDRDPGFDCLSASLLSPRSCRRVAHTFDMAQQGWGSCAGTEPRSASETLKADVRYRCRRRAARHRCRARRQRRRGRRRDCTRSAWARLGSRASARRHSRSSLVAAHLRRGDARPSRGALTSRRSFKTGDRFEDRRGVHCAERPVQVEFAISDRATNSSHHVKRGLSHSEIERPGLAARHGAQSALQAIVRGSAGSPRRAQHAAGRREQLPVRST